MKASIDRAVPTLLLALSLATLAACERTPEPDAMSAPGAETLLTAAGSTFAAPIVERWASAYSSAHPGVHLSYAAVGSGEGVDRFLAGSVDIGVTDAPLRPEEASRVTGGFLQLPVTGGSIGIAYNLPGVQGPLNLPRDVYPGIFLGTIYRWDDPRIAAANPGLDLPGKLIQVVARRDSSGTTFAFTNHLAAISGDWAAGPGLGKQIDWPGGAMEANGNAGVAQRIQITEGSIGYVEAGFAERLGLPLAWIENRAGGFVQPNVETGRRGLADGSDGPPTDLARVIPDPQGARSYPIVTYSWALIPGDGDSPEKTSAIVDLMHWILTQGQSDAEDMGLVPLPENLIEAGLAELAALER